MIIFYFTQNSLELGLTAMISFIMFDWTRTTSSFWYFFSTILAGGCLILFLFMPFYIFKAAREYRSLFYAIGSNAETKFGKMFTGMKHRSLLSLNFNTLFLIRRYFMISILLYMKTPQLQIVAQLLSSSAFVLYTMESNPFTESKMNILEALNEFIIIGLAYPLFFYTDYCTNDLRYQIGWSTIALIISDFLLNVGFMFQAVSAKFKRSLLIRKSKINMREWKRKQEQQELQ